jgi:hypothetical protein
MDDRSDSLGVIVSGQTHKDIYLADVDQLAKKIIGKKSPIFQFQLVRITTARPRKPRHVTSFPVSSFG